MIDKGEPIKLLDGLQIKGLTFITIMEKYISNTPNSFHYLYFVSLIPRVVSTVVMCYGHRYSYCHDYYGFMYIHIKLFQNQFSLKFVVFSGHLFNEVGLVYHSLQFFRLL